jgi:hypothetical protein
MEQEREEQIKKENKALYMKMTQITEDGAGNVAPKRNKRQTLSMISPLTDKNSNSNYFSTGLNSATNLEHSRMLS